MGKTWLIRFLLISGTACAVTANRRFEFEKALKSLAAKDLNCPVAEIRMYPVGDAYVEGTDLPTYQRVDVRSESGLRRRVSRI